MQKEQQKYCSCKNMVEYSKVNVKLSDTQLKKLKTTAKNKTGTTLRMKKERIYHKNCY